MELRHGRSTAIDGSITVNSENGLLLVLMAWWAALDPAFASPNLVIGRTATWDASSVTPVSVS
ncbi:hypothetical protein J8F10_13690 [Gemmata sp. G18]|uniref:Uncharacterized protein n=1 Tax=Gemmata palustris TaxID=2822762 RepID=A0ABS5BTY1_9BACT|nr:hypothetical protein [Gemmata palustris]MBP3956338.1 hypothetical protein [Gemmata palustris]